MAVFPKSEVTHTSAQVVSLRCPACGQNGSFAGYANIPDLQWIEPIDNPRTGGGAAKVNAHFCAGLRRCPNPECNCAMFVVRLGTKVLDSYPHQVIDFDSSNLPLKVQSSLEEAILCEAAGCYRASALMVRRVLEELCVDKKASGKDLRDRIAALGAVVIVPPELLTAADELRFLGNDAAHVEAKAYDNIAKEEVGIAIELTKELLKAVYQFSDLLGRLKALKKPSP